MTAALDNFETMSLFGKPLYAKSMRTGADVAALEQRVAEAKAAAEAAPDDVNKFIAYADAVTVMGNYQAAVALYSIGLQRWPDEAMLYCRRGHRYINMRHFDLALRDLQQAASMRTDLFDIWYHLGLAHWMKGDVNAAYEAFLRCQQVVDGDSEQVAVTDWLYKCLHRMGRVEEAAPLLEPIHPDMVMTGNNKNYLNLLLFYRGDMTEEELVATCRPQTLDFAGVGFALGCWHLAEGRTAEAVSYFERAAAADHWAAWGVMGSEVELARLAEKGAVAQPGAAARPEPELINELGQPLYSAMPLTGLDVEALMARREAARQASEADPDDVWKYIAYVKTVDAMHEYNRALELFTEGIARWPDEGMLYCHRGHRYINVRQFDLALADLNRANELRPDSFDVLYHLGLAHYMKGNFEQALAAFMRCHEVTSDDGDIPPSSALKLIAPAAVLQVGTIDWIYMTLSRLGRHDEAVAMLDKIDPNIEAGGNMIFYLNRVRFYKGLISEEELVAQFAKGPLGPQTLGYALGNWHLCRGNRQKAFDYFLPVIQGTMWPAFGNIAAEMELARWG